MFERDTWSGAISTLGVHKHQQTGRDCSRGPESGFWPLWFVDDQHRDQAWTLLVKAWTLFHNLDQLDWPTLAQQQAHPRRASAYSHFHGHSGDSGGGGGGDSSNGVSIQFIIFPFGFSSFLAFQAVRGHPRDDDRPTHSSVA